MACMNKLHLVGQVATVPVYHCTERGQDLVRVQLITQSNGTKQIHHCTAWGPLALSLYDRLRKGYTLAVHGQLIYRSYTYGGKTFQLPTVKVQGYSILAGATSSVKRATGRLSVAGCAT